VGHVLIIKSLGELLITLSKQGARPLRGFRYWSAACK